jgi:hypothetical protein
MSITEDELQSLSLSHRFLQAIAKRICQSIDSKGCIAEPMCLEARTASGSSIPGVIRRARILESAIRRPYAEHVFLPYPSDVGIQYLSVGNEVPKDGLGLHVPRYWSPYLSRHLPCLSRLSHIFSPPLTPFHHLDTTLSPSRSHDSSSTSRSFLSSKS